MEENVCPVEPKIKHVENGFVLPLSVRNTRTENVSGFVGPAGLGVQINKGFAWAYRKHIFIMVNLSFFGGWGWGVQDEGEYLSWGNGDVKSILTVGLEK